MQVLITGANRGVGAALSETLTARGHEVTATARSGAGFVPLDVTRPETIRAMAEGLGGAPLDALVCNAGVFLDRGQDLGSGYPADMWAEEFSVNVTGVFLTIQALLPNLTAAGGKVMIISSQMASSERAPGGSLIYRASKAAALNLGRNLAADLRGAGIAVGIYHPGWVRTDMGGSGADLSPAAAAEGLADRLDALTLDTTGCFETWDGRAHPY